MSTLYKVLKAASVNQKTAELLKELGFDEPCLAYWFKDSFIEGRYQNANSIFVNDTPCIVSDQLGNAAPLINQARDWLNKRYSISFNWYITDKNLYNYFIFIKKKMSAKGSLPFVENYQTEQMACLHACIIIKDCFKNP